MGTKKISELDAATTPLAGTELLEIVQGGASKQVAASALGGGSSSDFPNVFPVRSYGALPDSTADEAANIQSAINAAEAAGGGIVLFEVGDYEISTGLVIDSHAVTLQGVRSRSPSNAAAVGGSRLVWAGADEAATFLVHFTTPAGASTPINWGGGIKHLSLDGGGTCHRGLRITSWLGGRVEHVDIRNLSTTRANTTGIQTESLAAGDLASPSDTQEWVFENFYIRLLGAGYGIRLLGATGANSSFNTFRNGWIIHDDADGIFLFSADNNIFDHIRVWCADGGTGFSLQIGGNITNTNVNDANSFRNCYFQAKMAFLGTESSYTLGKAAGNKLIDLDASNSSATPTSSGSVVESGGSPILWRTSVQTTFTSTG